VIDLHVHVLPGIDDGPADDGGALALARAATAQGTRTVVATPHVNLVHPNRSRGIADGVAKVNAAIAAAGFALDVRTGAEIAIEALPDLDDDELRALALGRGPYLLVESPLSPSAGDVEPAVRGLLERGHRVVLAHPERSPGFQRRPESLGRLVARGVLCSITAGALTGDFGRAVRSFTTQLLADGLVHDVASDAHDAVRRGPGLHGALELIGDERLGRWLVEEVPAAVLEGAPVPAAPMRSGDRPRSRLRRLLTR
jgi:protein-tyrosine phosphatase